METVKSNEAVAFLSPGSGDDIILVVLHSQDIMTGLNKLRMRCNDE